MFLSFAAAGGSAFLVSCFVCALVRRFASRIGLIDKPGERKIHTVSVPVGGGIGIWCGILLPILCIFAAAALTVHGFHIPIPVHLQNYAAGILYSGGRLTLLLFLASILFVLGTLDDRFALGWKIRFFIEFLVAAAAVAAGWKTTCFLKVPFLAEMVSVIWIVGLTNSFNLLDNMDGLSSGVAIICASFLSAVFLLCTANQESGDPQFFLAGFLILLIGAILGFWVHNMPKARLFMGDGGAYFIGFLLAVATLSATFAGAENPPQAMLTPLCILAVPIYDTVSVVCIRLAHGKSPFVGDTNHYSHRLVAIGLSKTGAVLTIYLTTAICGIGALFLYQVNRVSAFLIALQIGMVLLLNGILEFTALRKINKNGK